jgi:GNAT superfamily N-acetyltransferase
VDPALRPDDLAPGDRPVARQDWSDVAVRRVRDAADPDFALAYQRLWAAFGPGGGMETEAVIRERLAWDPARPLAERPAGDGPGSGDAGRVALAYELLVLRRAGSLAALRDHTAVVRLDGGGRPRPAPVVVHLSHAWVEPAERGSGLAAWLRALPLQAARRCAAAAGASAGAPMVLVAEMESPDPDKTERTIRLRSYERAGFQKVDPVAAPYAQPDFRPPEVLARSAPRPLPLDLILRRVGREDEREMPAAELAAVVAAIYAVYGQHVPSAALAPLAAAAARFTARQPSFRLLPPTA